MVSSLLFVTSLCFQIQGTPAGFRPNTPGVKQTGPGDSAVIANKIGIAYHQMLDLENARKNYERAVKLRPDYAEAINNLGTVYYARKSYRRSITQYKKALRLTPESASILSNLGTSYFARKNYELAF